MVTANATGVIALDLDEGHLVYAKGDETPLTHVVRNTGIAIRCHALDLARRPNELLDQVDRLAATVADKGRAQTPRGVA